MKRYINFKGENGIETVDEFEYNTRDEREEYRRCLKEYHLSGSGYYGSSRCTNAWKER
jgi:hypothetical protein